MHVSPDQAEVQARLAAFLEAVAPGFEVISYQDNKVPEPKTADWIMMTPLRIPRLRTNVDSAADCRFTGSIAGTALTVAAVQIGTVEIGALVFGVGVTAGTTVESGPSGGGPGSYVVDPAQTVPPSTVMSTGQKQVEQAAEWVFQLDFHSGEVLEAGDAAQVVSTLFRDGFAVDFFARLGSEVTPLFADDPRQAPFMNDQQQYEKRWISEAHLQVNQTVVVPQQYADAVSVQVISVDATYPP